MVHFDLAYMYIYLHQPADEDKQTPFHNIEIFLECSNNDCMVLI